LNPYEADNWEEVESTNIAAVGSRDRYLIVKFLKGGVAYRYSGAASEFEALIHAESVGRYFAKEIKPQYGCEKLPSEESGWPERDEY